jgi:hypothetical protein
MSAARFELERAASAVLVPAASAVLAALELQDFAPAGIFVPASSADPRGEVAAVRKSLERAGQAVCFAACELANGIELPGERATKLPCALALAAAEEGSPRERRWIRTAAAIAGSEARAADIELLVPRSRPAALEGFGDDLVRPLRCSRELLAGWRSAGIEGCFEASLAEAGDVCAIARTTSPDVAWGGTLLADARDRTPGDGELARNLVQGCAGVLLGGDVLAARATLIEAVASGLLRRERLLHCAERMLALRDRLRQQRPQLAPSGIESLDRGAFALDAASAGLCLSRRWAWKPGWSCELLAPLQPVASLEVRTFLERLRPELARNPRPGGALLPVVSESKLDAPELAEIDAKVASLLELGWPVGVLWMAEPSWLPTAWWARRKPSILIGFQATALALQAARRWLLGEGRAGGSLPCNLG